MYIIIYSLYSLWLLFGFMYGLGLIAELHALKKNQKQSPPMFVITNTYNKPIRNNNNKIKFTKIFL